jgi:predicted RNA binding protein YcfA (HicA-like mRNA interferase family)
MSQSINAALKGIRPNMRDEIRALHAEGWVPSKTNGGHIKLQHPNTEIPVFCSSTPGDKKTHLYLRKDCRNALLGTTRIVPQAPSISDEEARRIMRSRKSSKRLSSAKRSLKNPVLKDQADFVKNDHDLRVEPDPQPVRIEISAEVSSEPVETNLPRGSDPEPLEIGTEGMSAQGPETPKPETRKPASRKPKPKKDTLKMNMMITPRTELDATPPVPVSMTVPAARAKPAKAAPHAHDPRSIEYGIQLGLRIARGELTALVITADMVGQKLLFEQAPYVVGDISTASGSEATAQAPSFRKNTGINDTIMELLNLYPGQEVTLAMIAQETVIREHYKNIDSARASLRKRLERLQDEGIILYRHKPGEPCAWLKV